MVTAMFLTWKIGGGKLTVSMIEMEKVSSKLFRRSLDRDLGDVASIVL